MDNTPYTTQIHDSGKPNYVNRILIGVPTTGLVRIEWVQARYGQIIPVNWSQTDMLQFINSYIPLRFQVDTAQNMICSFLLEHNYEWLLFYEHDVLPPANAFVRLNEYMRQGQIPIVSGLYFTRCLPSEPLIFRGRGSGAFTDFKLGDQVYCDGVPTGFLLIHASIIQRMWEDSPPEPNAPPSKVPVRQVFRTPRDIWSDPSGQGAMVISGTSDLDWCTRVLEGDYLRKAGWSSYVDSLPNPKMPFLVDTHLLCGHINNDGSCYPTPEALAPFIPAPVVHQIQVEDGVRLKDR